MLRIGHGYDTHSFESGVPLMLGGVLIPHPRGMKAHSDGDVLYHAVCDALLGAAGLGDIGQHFPDTDQQYTNMDSRLFLRHIVTLIKQKQYSINNIDTTILAQVPRVAPFVDQMRMNLACDLEIGLEQVNVKATTTEKMGYIGREEGIACYAVVLIGSSAR